MLVLTVLLVSGYGFYRLADHLVHHSDMFVLRNIEVSGNRYVKEAEIVAAAELQPGMRLMEVDPDRVVARILERIKYLEGVSVGRSFPSTLMISVQERQPVAYLVDHRVYMVDRHGVILLKKPDMDLQNLPLISGLTVRKLLQDRQPLLDALGLIQKIKEVDDGLFHVISEIHLNVKRPPTIYLIRGGARVNLGNENYYQRLYLLSQLLRKSSILSELDRIKKIDLSFENRIILTRKS